jgi:glycosyltransferase involved in cell wall biosynthesis
MKIVLSTIGKYHTFDLARELHGRGLLAAVFTGYPQFKLREEQLPREKIRSFPWVQGPYMAFPWKHLLSPVIVREWAQLSATTFGNWVAKNIPPCDLYVGLSGSGLGGGKVVHRQGAKYVCDRGSAHIRVQDQLLREEHAAWGLPFHGIDPRAIEREEQEYEEADCITIPSKFAWRSFITLGVPESRLQVLPYGVDLSRFSPVAKPDVKRFDVLFVGGMSLQKGIPYLVNAFRQLQHPRKSLTFVGAPSPVLIDRLKKIGIWTDDFKVLGHLPQIKLKEIMSRSHVMVLPSIQDGFGLVLAQAMACACPVIASDNTGSEDLFADGVEGFIVPIRNTAVLASRMQWLADNPDEREAMSGRALARVQSLGGWKTYGDNAASIYAEVVKR